MVTRKNRSRGFTLPEVLIVTLILPIVFIAAATVYSTATGFFFKAKNAAGRLDSLMTAETIARKITMANKVVIDQGNQQIRIRWDYAVDSFAAKNTPKDFTDDTWVKFRIIGGKLYWRNDSGNPSNPDDPGVDVTNDLSTGSGNSEWITGMQALGVSSAFTSINPSGVGTPTVVNILLATQTGSPPQPLTISTDAAIGAMAKN